LAKNWRADPPGWMMIIAAMITVTLTIAAVAPAARAIPMLP
jgi:hypothetical protein